jgi:hypothetical protein
MSLASYQMHLTACPTFNAADCVRVQCQDGQMSKPGRVTGWVIQAGFCILMAPI